MKTWTNDEIQYLKENYGKIPNKDICIKLNRSLYSIYMMIHKLSTGVYKYKGCHRKNFSESEFLTIIETSNSHKEALNKLGYKKTCIGKSRYKNLLNKLQPNLNHFKYSYNRKLSNGTKPIKKGTSVESLYNLYKSSAKRRKLDFKITLEELLLIMNQKCYYCNSNGDSRYNSFVYTGIDRKDNNKGYIINNCIPCCKHCNYAKNKKTEKEFLEHIKRIYEYQQSKKKLG